MLVTRVIGTKIRRLPKTSATRPSTRGWLTSLRTDATRSLTLPTWSPWGSKIGSPISRATKTREGAVLTKSNRSRSGAGRVLAGRSSRGNFAAPRRTASWGRPGKERFTGPDGHHRGPDRQSEERRKGKEGARTGRPWRAK